MEDLNFTITNDMGIEVKCDVLSLINDDQDKTYVIYTDYTMNDENKYNVYASQLINVDGKVVLEEIENTELIPGFQDVYNDALKQLNINE